MSRRIRWPSKSPWSSPLARSSPEIPWRARVCRAGEPAGAAPIRDRLRTPSWRPGRPISPAGARAVGYVCFWASEASGNPTRFNLVGTDSTERSISGGERRWQKWALVGRRCRGRDSNPHGRLAPRILSPVRLPIPPPRHLVAKRLNHRPPVAPTEQRSSDRRFQLRARRPSG